MRIIRVFVPVIAVMFSAGLAYAGGGTALTYQGRLLDAGEPANGKFNFVFRLWDDPAAGSQIGSTVGFNGLPISDGLITVELDFGANAFDNTDRWLEISVNGLPLEPRQAITRAPYSIQTRGIFVDEDQNVGIGTTIPQAALHATSDALTDTIIAYSENRSAVIGRSNYVNGVGIWGRNDIDNNLGYLGSTQYGVYGSASDVNNDWAGYFSGRAHVSNTLFVGREDPITGNEYFGVNAPVGDSAFGGMFVSTNTHGGWPFYGYSAGGNADMWHVYDGNTGKWHLYNGGSVRLTVTNTGEVSIGSQNPLSNRRLYVETDVGTAIHGVKTGASSLYAGFFSGWVHVDGTLSKNAGAFRIDHPLDPENKYLYHSFVESPDMMNIYNGNVVTDADGYAMVELADWFDALNRDFRYQLTVIGTFAQAIIAEKIRENRFVIQTDRPHIEVSWQVTGVRHDDYAEENRIPVEAYKTEFDREIERNSRTTNGKNAEARVGGDFKQLTGELR